MTSKEKIELLEKEIADLKLRLAAVEARPFIITVPQFPANPVSPHPNYPQPYIDDPVYPYGSMTVSGAVSGPQRSLSGSSSMSMQSSDRLQ